MIELAILTNKNRDLAEHIEENFLTAGIFKYILGAIDRRVAKPHGYLTWELVDLMRVFRTYEELVDHKAAMIIYKPAKLLKSRRLTILLNRI